jgi:hypothetical protein
MLNQNDVRELIPSEIDFVSGGDESHRKSGKELGDKLEDVAQDIAEGAREVAKKIGDWWDRHFG